MPHAQINGARLWFDMHGEGEPLLLHHGYTASRVNWLPAAELLMDRYKIILMECRGTGDSEHTARGYSMAQYTDDVVGLLDHLALDTVTFAGHSMGGGIGFLLGLHHAHRLQRLVLMAPLPAAGIAKSSPEVLAQRIEERRQGDRQVILDRYRQMRFREDAETDAWFEDRVDHVLGVSQGHFEQSVLSMQEFNVEDQLHRITTPTLMISGAVDHLLASNLRDYMRLPNATLEVLSRAGHEVAVHEPQRVAQAIDNFMQYGPITAASLLARSAAPRD